MIDVGKQSPSLGGVLPDVAGSISAGEVLGMSHDDNNTCDDHKNTSADDKILIMIVLICNDHILNSLHMNTKAGL